MSELPATASFREFADLAGFRPSYVTELRRAKRLVLTDDGKCVKVAESLALIEATRDPSRAGVAARHAAAREEANADMGDAGDGEPQDEPGEPPAPPESPYHRHKAESERWRAASAKRDFEVSIGKLLDAADVESAAAQAGLSLRRALERMPDDLAPRLAALTDEREVRDLLREEIHHALVEMARALGKLGKTAA